MYRIDNIIKEKDRIKENILFLLKSYGITIEEIIIDFPRDLNSFIENGLEVKLVSPDFRKMTLLTKIGLLSRVSSEINPRLRAKGYTPEEYHTIIEPIKHLKGITDEKNSIGPRR